MSTIYAVIGDGPSEGIWGINGTALVCTDIVMDGTSLDERIEMITTMAESIKAETGNSYRIRKFALIEEGQ